MGIGMSGNPNEYSANPLGVVRIDTTFRFSSNDSIHLNDGIMSADLVLDSITKTFRGFVLSSNCSSKSSYPNNDNSCYSWPIQCYGYEQSAILFRMTSDSVPYADSAGMISTTGVFDMPYSISAQYECLEGHQTWTGSCLDSGTLADTLDIRIVPNAFSRVSFREQAVTRVTLLDPTSDLVLCSVPFSKDASVVEIFNLLGKKISLISIRSREYGLEALTPDLPPGCYFARLGDQVAKFIIPPR